MRLQLALDVDDLDRAVDFYAAMFGVAPAKRRPGYANFVVADPPLKLVLFEGGAPGAINHLGVETSSPEEVVAAEARLAATGLETTGVDETVCCYAEKTETWVESPEGHRWEWYVATADADQLESTVVRSVAPAGGGEAAAAEATAPLDAGRPGCCG